MKRPYLISVEEKLLNVLELEYGTKLLFEQFCISCLWVLSILKQVSYLYIKCFKCIINFTVFYSKTLQFCERFFATVDYL
jgi:phage FluMu protein Com